MNFSARNIWVVLFAALLGIYLLTPKANAAGKCTGSMCLQCNRMLFSVNKSVSKAGFDDHMCDTAFGNSPCNLDKNSNSTAPVVIVPAKNQNRQKPGALLGFSGYNSSIFQNIRVNDEASRFRFASGTIPLYLQNHSFLC
jgi:hypothetical protein